MEESLVEWYNRYPKMEDVTNKFILMDRTLKYIHENGYYVTNFNPKNIMIGLNSSDSYIVYKSISPMSSDAKNLEASNIYNLAFLELSIYANMLEAIDYLKPQFVKEHFNEFKVFLPEELASYYQMVLVSNGGGYLSDYVNSKNEKLINDTAGALGNSNNKKLVKSNGHYQSDDKMVPIEMLDKNNNNIGAFVSSFLLTFIVIALTLLIPLVIFLVNK